MDERRGESPNSISTKCASKRSVSVWLRFSLLSEPLESNKDTFGIEEREEKEKSLEG